MKVEEKLATFLPRLVIMILSNCHLAAWKFENNITAAAVIGVIPS